MTTGTAVALAPAVAAAPSGATPELSKHVMHMPAKQGRGVGTQSAGSGGHTGDFTVDGWPDILARQQNNGDLKVYPHSRTFNGIFTYQPATTINFNWSGQRWIGQGRMAGGMVGEPRNIADVVSIGFDGVMRVHRHSGTFNGTSTLQSSMVISTGWNINDLVFIFDLDADGWDDVMARRAGTGDTYVYFHSGTPSGFDTLLPPQLLISGGEADRDQLMADVTMDGVPDLVFLEDQFLAVFDPVTDVSYLLGTGWNTINAVALTDVNLDGRPDILGRVAANGNLQVYLHSGIWAPDANDIAFSTYQSVVLLGFNWFVNDVIT
ncbi:hypothetical protein [Actinophytocola sp.]|uniref:hypothetical protein n=1 Tax=Actinophytocola sp. TaxID=1872138 RepID=UPI002D7FD82C|nr:hypothetical protein [Actinophytocola sp.]HET9141692.1 hypothetical protein [Actinophytocola sp.]HEU5111649.1 hypothetical protein [Micromonosporaceae bacterium]